MFIYKHPLSSLFIYKSLYGASVLINRHSYLVVTCSKDVNVDLVIDPAYYTYSIGLKGAEEESVLSIPRNKTSSDLNHHVPLWSLLPNDPSVSAAAGTAEKLYTVRSK